MYISGSSKNNVTSSDWEPSSMIERHSQRPSAYTCIIQNDPFINQPLATRINVYTYDFKQFFFSNEGTPVFSKVILKIHNAIHKGVK